MGALEAELKQHFTSKVLPLATQLQGSSSDNLNTGSVTELYTADKFGLELIACIQDLSPAQVIKAAKKANRFSKPNHSKCSSVII